MEPSASSSSAEATALQCASDQDLRVPFYCEENAWRVAFRHTHSSDNRKPSNEEEDVWEYYVVFISNQLRCCPLFKQRAVAPDEYVSWDYHVIVIRTRESCSTSSDGDNKNATEVLDVDSWLQYSCPIEEYLDGTFPHTTNEDLDPKYMPMFRVIPTKQYLKYFYSDRMHMYGDGKWSRPPPSYAPIMNGLEFASGEPLTTGDAASDDCNGVRASNLDSFIDMSEAKNQTTYGEVFTLDQLCARFGVELS